MKTQPLAHTEVDVSALCLGAMFLGTRTDKAMSHRILDAYVDAGGSFIDTANIYAWWVEGGKGGESEILLGEWMRERGNRDRVFLASKVGFGYGSVPTGLTAKLIEEECDKSLKRMQVDTIDLYYAHVDDRKTPLEETMQALDKLVKVGKVRFIGASNYLAWRLEQAYRISRENDWTKFCCIQQRYTYLRLKPGATFSPQSFANDDLLDCCRSTGVTLLAYSVLLGGAYTRVDRSIPAQHTGADSDKRLEALRAVAEQSGVTVNQIVLRWMLQSSPRILPLIAASDEAQLQENLGALDFELTAEQMEFLDKAGQ